MVTVRVNGESIRDAIVLYLQGSLLTLSLAKIQSQICVTLSQVSQVDFLSREHYQNEK